jgi:hypothetical protein
MGAVTIESPSVLDVVIGSAFADGSRRLTADLAGQTRRGDGDFPGLAESGSR